MQLNKIRKETFKILKEKNNWIILILNLIIVRLLYFGVQKLYSYDQKIGLLLYVLFYLAIIPLCYGIIITFIKKYKKEDVYILDFITYGFENFTKAWKLLFSKILKILPIVIIYGAIHLLNKYYLSEKIFEICNNNLTDFNKMILYYRIYQWTIWIIMNALKIIAHFKLIDYTLAEFIAYEDENIEIKKELEKSKKIIRNDRINWLKLNYLYIIVYTIIRYMLFGLFSFIVYNGNFDNKFLSILSESTNIVTISIKIIFILYILMQRIVAYNSKEKIVEDKTEKIEEVM